jgi:hypothetical protein
MPDRKSRRLFMGAARRLLALGDEGAPGHAPMDDIPRLTLSALERIRMFRSRERIMSNLDEMYREAFDRAKASDEADIHAEGAAPNAQMTTLDFAYRREQLYLEILLDIRDALERR